MKIKRIIVAGTISALLLGLAGTGTALVLMREKVRTLEQERAQLAQKMKEQAAQARTQSRSVPKKERAAKAPPRVRDVKPIAKMGQSFFTYAVRDGEDLVSIAIKHGISPSMLMDFNNLKADDVVVSGMALKIPGVKGEAVARQENADSRVATNAAPVELRVVRTDYDGETTLRLHLTQRPDMDVIRV